MKLEDAGCSIAAPTEEDGVTRDSCTHGPGSLSEGFIEDDIVECNFHRGAFNIRTGEAVSPPCVVPVRSYEIVVLEGSVYIDPHRPRSS